MLSLKDRLKGAAKRQMDVNKRRRPMKTMSTLNSLSSKQAVQIGVIAKKGLELPSGKHYRAGNEALLDVYNLYLDVEPPFTELYNQNGISLSYRETGSVTVVKVKNLMEGCTGKDVVRVLMDLNLWIEWDRHGLSRAQSVGVLDENNDLIDLTYEARSTWYPRQFQLLRSYRTVVDNRGLESEALIFQSVNHPVFKQTSSGTGTGSQVFTSSSRLDVPVDRGSMHAKCVMLPSGYIIQEFAPNQVMMTTIMQLDLESLVVFADDLLDGSGEQGAIVNEQECIRDLSRFGRIRQRQDRLLEFAVNAIPPLRDVPPPVDTAGLKGKATSDSLPASPRRHTSSIMSKLSFGDISSFGPEFVDPSVSPSVSMSAGSVSIIDDC